MRRAAASAVGLFLACGGPEGARHFAVAARASAQDFVGGGPEQAVGPPDAIACGDSPLAWAAPAWSLSWIELEYQNEVVARAVGVHETRDPGHVARVEVRPRDGEWRTILTRLPAPEPVCPSLLSVPIDPPAPVFLVRLWVDSQADGASPQIDAVELEGDVADPR